VKLPPVPIELKNAPDVEVLKQAYVAMHLYNFELAAACFDEVYQRDRDNPYALVELACACFKMFELSPATETLRQALSRAGRDAAPWMIAGDVYQDARQDEDGEYCSLQARRKAGNDLGVTARLISFYEARGQLEKAEAVLVRADQQRRGRWTSAPGGQLQLLR